MKKILFVAATLLVITANAQWVTNGPVGITNTVTSTVVNGNNIFAGTDGAGVFISADTGASWTAVNNGLTNKTVLALTVSGSNIFAGTNGSVYLSTDNGSSWITVDSGLKSTSMVVYSLASIGSYIFAGIEGGGVYVSTNSGTTWAPSNTGLTTIFPTTLIANGTNLYVGSQYGGIYLSTNYGANWSAINHDSLNSDGVNALAVTDSVIYAGTMLHGVYVTTNNGTSWNSVNNGIVSNYNVYSFLVIGTAVYVSTQSDSLYKTTDKGAHWTSVGTGLPNGTFITSLTTLGSTLFAGTNSKGIWQKNLLTVPSCSAHFTVAPDNAMAHHWFALNRATGTGPLTYSWNWGDGSNSSSGPTPSHIYSSAANFNICLTITDSTGCTSIYCDSSTYIYKTDAGDITVNCVTELPVATGVSPLVKTISFHVYPNPTSSNFTIETTGTGAQQLQFFNMEGQLLLSQTITGSKTTISTNNLPAGIYTVCLKGEEGVATQKLVVAK